MKQLQDFFTKLKIYGPSKILSFIVSELKMKFYYGAIKQSYSQKQEDLFIDKFFKGKKSGFYVDVGANNPDRFSNTKKFYLNGWKGINIEPDVSNYNKFVIRRKKDINLNIGIGLKKGKLKFFKFMPDTLSTFSSEEAKRYIKLGHPLENELDIEVKPLSMVLQEHCKNKVIDFISIDTEGFDMQVLMSNNWKLYNPTLICIESVEYEINSKKKATNVNNDIFLNKKGYKKIYDNGLNSIYKVNS